MDKIKTKRVRDLCQFLKVFLKIFTEIQKKNIKVFPNEKLYALSLAHKLENIVF